MRVFIMKKSLVFRIAAFVVILAAIFVYAKIMMQDDTAVFAQNGVLTAGDGTENIVAITIDTSFGDADYTAEILDVLEDHDAQATFAVMGAWARENPDLVREIITQGHDVISHSMAHERYADLGTADAVADAKANREYLSAEFGVATDFLRLPYGNGTDEIYAALQQEGFRIVGWSLDSRDWSGIDAEKISDGIIKKIKAGEILLFQNNVAATPEALDLILQKLGDRAYETVTLEDIDNNETEMREG